MIYLYSVTFINSHGDQITREVEAHNEFEAKQIAGAFNFVVLSIVNLDL